MTRLARVDQPLRPEAARDVAAARTRLMHTVYLATHGVGVALRAYCAQMTDLLTNRQPVPVGESLHHARRTLERLGAAESLAGAYLAGRWPTALAGEHRDPPAPTRLPLALAAWDLQAHRTLAHTPTTGNLLYIAHVQHHLALATQLVMRAAADTGAIDAAQYRNRLQPALADVESSWSHLGGLLHQLTSPSQRRVDPPLLLAGSEARAAIRDITHDGAGPQPPPHMAQTTDLTRASSAFYSANAACLDLTHVMADVVADATLHGRAAGIHAIASTRANAHTPHAAWVDASHLYLNKTITLVEPVRDALTEGLHRATQAAATADSEGSFLPASAAAARTQPEQPPRPPGRR